MCNFYGVFSVVACTLLCESGSTGSIPVRHPKLLQVVDKAKCFVDASKVTYYEIVIIDIVDHNTAHPIV